ncbi:MAG: hypothetical protein ABEJ91_03740 [Candidatus Nanohaloarchaea archaeon]
MLEPGFEVKIPVDALINVPYQVFSMIGIILLAYLLIAAGILVLVGGGVAYYLERDFAGKVALAGAGLLVVGISLLVYFLAGF